MIKSIAMMNMRMIMIYTKDIKLIPKNCSKKCQIKDMLLSVKWFSACVVKQYIDIMIDRVLNFGPVQQESYYFQLIPISLSIVNKQCELPAQGTTYKFIVVKGQQKFDENKIPVQATFQVVGGVPALAITTCRLNFYLPSYNKLRKQDFTLQMMQRENNQDYEVGEYLISTEQLITQFKENNKNRHEIKANFSEDYLLEFEIYVERNRMALERNIRDNKTERINKSPLRARKDEKPETAKKSLSGQQTSPNNITPSRDREEPISQTSPQPSRQEEKAEARTEINEEKVEQNVEEKVQVKAQDKIEEIVDERDVQETRRSSPPKVEATEQVKSVKKQTSQIREKSQKNQVQSRRSNDHVPIISTKQKQLARPDTPKEVNLSESQRLLSVVPESSSSAKESSELKQKLLMWLFMLVSGVIMYYAMHPNKKV